MKIQFLLETKNTADLEIREVLVNLKFSNVRSFSEILTQIRAIKGVTVISIIKPSRIVSGNDKDNDAAKTYFATIKIKIEISALGLKNYVRFLQKQIKSIHGIIAIQVKKEAPQIPQYRKPEEQRPKPQIDPNKALEIKKLLTI